jgi:hypothetical protein
VKHLERLTELDLSFNRLKEITPAVAECHQLIYLNISNNQLEVRAHAVACMPATQGSERPPGCTGRAESMCGARACPVPDRGSREPARRRFRQSWVSSPISLSST